MAWLRKTRAAPEPLTLFSAMSGGPIGPNSIAPMLAGFPSGYAFSPYFAEKLGTVARCLQLNAQQISTMPLNLRGAVDTPPWLTNPDPEVYNGIHEALFAAIWSRYARGEYFLYATSRLATGYPATWVVLDPLTMRVEYDAYGVRQYESNGFPLAREDVLHVMRDPRPGQLRGTPALSAYWSNLQSAFSTESFAADFFARSGVPSTVLKFGGKLTARQATDLQEQWIAAVSARSGAPAVLDQGLDLTVLSFSPKDLMLLELREYDAKQLAAAFGVPGFLLNLPQAGGLNYSNPAMLFDLWWRAELMPAAAATESALSTWLPRGNWVAFDPSVILRPDFQVLVSTYLALLDKGVVNVDEVRAQVLNLPPMEAETDLRTFGEPASAADSAPVALGVVG